MNAMIPPVCNIEELVQVAPFAIIYLFQASLGMMVTTLHWTSYCSTKTLLCVAVYAAGLTVLERKQTQSRIARTLGHVTHDALNRLAGQLGDLYDQMIVGLLLLLETFTPGFLILDDVFLPKPFAHYIAGAYMGYDHVQRRHLVGQRIVVILWTNGLVCLPVAFAFWHHREFVRKYRTKNQIARALIYWVVRHHLPFTYLTFDNWYASKHNLSFFNRLGIIFVTRVRHNTWIVHEDHRQRVSHLTRAECHYYHKLNAYVRRFPVTYPKYGMGSLALVKHDKHEEPGRTKSLFTNDLSLTNTEFVLRYRSRWEIEMFFRTCKQFFGLGACQAQMMPQVLLHVRMVFLAYTLTQLLLSDPSMSVEQMQIHLRSLHCLSLPNSEPQLVVMQDDGTLLPVSLETLLVPLRTRIPWLKPMETPTIMEIMNAT